MMTHDQMLAFVLKMTKHGLDSIQHFDSGGTVLGAPTGGPSGTTGLAGAVGNVLGTSNSFQANPGTNTAQLQGAYDSATGAVNNANNLAGTLAPGVNQGAASQAGLTQQLRDQSMGIGPNPAQSRLNENTGQNIAQQAALAASTRGAGSNPGLTALTAGNVGSNIQQNSVGQAATLQAQQQLAAQAQLQNLAGTQVGQGINSVGMQNQANQGEQSILQGANDSANKINAQVSQGNQDQSGDLLGGIGSALGGIGGFLVGGPAGAAAGSSIGGSLFAEGGQVPEHLIHMASIYHPHHLQKKAPAQSAPTNVGEKLKAGGKVPGKPKVNHNAYKNDIVSAKLSPGEVVIPLDVINDKGKLGQMARFIAANIERKRSGRSL